MPPVDPTFHMWVAFALILATLTSYAWEKVPHEVTSLGIICAFLIFFHAFPVPGDDGRNALGPGAILSGFANPALIAVAALLVIGQGLVHSGVLDRAAGLVLKAGGGFPWLTIALVLVVVMATSAFLNNIPVVVIFIPIMQSLAGSLGRSASHIMMPLSYASILGGMTTLIGSSTNLLVSTELVDLGRQGFTFFEFTVPGLAMAAVGLAYLLLVAPRLLPDRASPAAELVGGEAKSGKQFIAQVTVSPTSKLVGEAEVGGMLPSLKDVTVRLIQRRERAILPPFEDITVQVGDVIVLAATRDALTKVLKRDPGLISGENGDSRSDDGQKRQATQTLAEVMVAPASRMIGQTLEQIGFRYRFGCIVLGIQRRSRMIRAQMNEIRLEAGDVLLIQGHQPDVRRLRGNPDVLLMEWSATEVPPPWHARRAVIIFLAVVAGMASGVVPVVVAAVTGAAAMIAGGCLNVRQASRAVDRNVVMMIAAALAMGTVMQETGGARYLAWSMVETLAGAAPWIVLSAFFLLVAVLSNIVSTKATAVLFTPVAVGIADALSVPPAAFAVAVVFAANCSFASPIGYQTNLLVMGPGHYRFSDFSRAGAPAIVLLWITFTLVAPVYFGLR